MTSIRLARNIRDANLETPPSPLACMVSQVALGSCLHTWMMRRFGIKRWMATCVAIAITMLLELVIIPVAILCFCMSVLALVLNELSKFITTMIVYHSTAICFYINPS